MRIEDLTPEQLKKAEGKSGEELLALAQAEGVELSDEELEAVSGGFSYNKTAPYTCPLCGAQGTVKPNATKSDDWWCTACCKSFS